MANSLALVWDLIAVDHASGTFGRVGAAADSASGGVKRLLEGFGLLAAGGAIAASVKQAADFQAQMLLIQTQAGATAQEVKNLTPAILSLAGQVAQAPEALATSLYHVESTGLRGAQALEAVKVAAEGAKVGHADLEQTTNALTALIASGMVPATEKYSEAMGQLNVIVGSGDMKMQDLNDALSSGLLVTTKQYGVTLNDVGAALADFGDNNIRGADAATMVRMAVQSIAKPGKDAADALGKIGLTVGQLQSDEQTGGLNKALTDLHTHLVNSGIDASQWGTILTDAFTKKAGTGLITLVGTFDRFQQKYQEVSKGADSFGSAWEATTKTANFQFGQLRQSVDTLGIQLGTHLLPVLGDTAGWLANTGVPAIEHFATGVGDAVHWFTQLPAPVRETALALGALALAEKIGLFDKLSASIGVVRTAFAGLRDEMALQQALAAMESATGAATMLDGALGTLATRGMAALKAGASSLVDMFGGPWVVALGGSVLAIKALNDAFVHDYDPAAAIALRDAQNLTSAQQSYTAALDASKGAIDANVRASAAKSLQDSGVLAIAQRAGVSLSEVTDAVLHQGHAYDDVKQKLQNYYYSMLISTGSGTEASRKQAQAAEDALNAFLKLGGDLPQEAQKQAQLSQAIYGTANTVDGLKNALQQMGLASQATWNQNTATINGATATQIQDLKNLGATVKTLPNGSITVTADTDPAKAAIDGLLKNYQNVTYTGSAIVVGAGMTRIIAKADGGAIVGPGTGTSDSIPALLSNGEHVWTAREVQSAGGHAAVAQMRKAVLSGMKAFAAGGPVGWNIGENFPVQASQTMLNAFKSYMDSLIPQIPGGGAAIPGNRASVAAIVQAMAAARGWGSGAEWAALSNVINRESGWNPNAANPTSSARGLFQKMTSINGPVESTVQGQTAWGLGYIGGRYGDPLGAWRHEQQFGWYRDGTNYVPNDGPAWLHKGEAVVPAARNQGAPYRDQGPSSTTINVTTGSGDPHEIARFIAREQRIQEFLHA